MFLLLQPRNSELYVRSHLSWRVYWCVAVYCSVLQCIAACCSVLQCIAACCSVLQCIAACCSVLQCVAVCCSVLQCIAVYCSVLQRVAVCCSVLWLIFATEDTECRSLYWKFATNSRTHLRKETHTGGQGRIGHMCGILQCHTCRGVESHVWMSHTWHPTLNK